MKRLTHAELAAAQERQDWTVLWEQALPLVKLVVGRMARSASERAGDDTLQEGMLIAGEAMRTWKPLECAYSTHVCNRVRWDLLRARSEDHNAGIGSYKQRPAVFSLADSRDGMFGFGANPEGDQGEDEDDGTFDAGLTYDGVRRPSGQYDGGGFTPEGFGDPADEADRQRTEERLRGAVDHLPSRMRGVVVAVMGLDGSPPETLRAYSERTGVARSTAWNVLSRATKTLGQMRPVFHHIKYGSKKT